MESSSSRDEDVVYELRIRLPAGMGGVLNIPGLRGKDTIGSVLSWVRSVLPADTPFELYATTTNSVPTNVLLGHSPGFEQQVLLQDVPLRNCELELHTKGWTSCDADNVRVQHNALVRQCFGLLCFTGRSSCGNLTPEKDKPGQKKPFMYAKSMSE